uniref:Hemolymph juvenile hormone binding protein n=1 Tax=Bombyx mori TaxID=7091 RepID=A0A8R1WFH9_BOMMO|nr:uncharacterized protein LOC101744925 [Bombyx mori]
MRVFVFLILYAVSVYGRVTPDFFPQCKRSDPQIDKCVLDAVETMRPRLKTGIPEVNIPPLDPFMVPTLKLDRTAPNLRLKATIKQTKAFGGSNFKIEKLKINLNNKYTGEIKMVFPKLMVVADYDVRGSRILTLDINGKGKLRGEFTGITVVAKGLAKPIQKDGVEYLQVDKILTRVRVSNAQIGFDDTERPLAAASAASFFNSSPGVVLDILNPLIEETSAAVIKAFVNKILGNIPLHEILVDDVPSAYVYPEDLKVTANISLPRLVMTGDYMVIGEFQMLPVESIGKMAANFSECTIALEALGARVHTRMVIRDARVRLRCAGPVGANLMEAHSTTDEMEMVTDHIVSMHSEDLVREVQPAIETALAMVLEDIANKFLKHVPAEMVFPNYHELPLLLKQCSYLFLINNNMLCIFLLICAISLCEGDNNFINFGGFICPREEKALGKCLKDALNEYIPKLATGLPEYGVPPSEPLIVPSISIQQSTGPITVTSSYSDVTVRGPSKMRIKDVQVNSVHRRVVAKLYIPELKMKGNYKLSGQLLMLPMNGEGQFTAKYGDIDATVTIILGREPRPNSVDALTCDQLDVNFHVGYASMQLENLFGGDGELSKAMNKFLNENWKKLSEELQVPMEEALRDFLKPLADHAFATLNADDILLT